MGKKGKGTTFEKRLKVYSATAAGLLAMAPAAQAAVQYSGIKNLPVNSSQFQTIDLNNDGIDDFNFGYYVLGTIPYPYFVSINSAAGGQGHIAETYNSDPVRLPSNYLIGPNLANPANYWSNTTWNTLNGSIYFGITSTMGNFNNAKGYIGVRFSADCGTAYGWIQYQGVTTIGNTATGTVIDWAYEDTCQPILAGSTESIAPVPTLNQWGLIAFTLLLGAVAARELRRSSKEKSGV